jgi:hypothetical protein
MRARAPHLVYLPALLAFHLLIVQAWGQNAPGQMLQIVVVDGEGATNNVRSRANKEPVVRVEDQNHRPVAGAAVIFFLPSQGPGGTYMNGTSSLTTTSDDRGRAVARGAQFNPQPGPMQIRVAASHAGQTASAVINQTNVVGPVVSGGSSSSSSGGGGLSTKAKVLIIVAIAAAGAAGAIVATRGGKSSGTASGPTVTISAGVPTVGAPSAP